MECYANGKSQFTVYLPTYRKDLTTVRRTHTLHSKPISIHVILYDQAEIIILNNHVPINVAISIVVNRCTIVKTAGRRMVSYGACETKRIGIYGAWANR